MSQSVLLSGESTTFLNVAPLTSSEKGFGMAKLNTPITGNPVGAMQKIPVPNPVGRADALAAAADWMTREIGPYKSRYGTWLKSEGLSVGFFNYTQEVMVTTELGPKKFNIAFNASVDQSGRATYGLPKLVDSDPILVEANYIPLRAIGGLPASWQYPDAGKIVWRVLNKRFEPLSGWRAIETNGAYDSALIELAGDQDAKLACLMDLRKAGCSGPKDIRGIMNDVGASYAIVNYMRSIEPVYEDTPEGIKPVGAISVDERVWTCVSYINKGHYGYVLSLVADQYVVRQESDKVNWQLLKQYGSKGISPTEPYNKEVTIAQMNSAFPGVGAESLVISPAVGDNQIFRITDKDFIKNLVYVAPVTVDPRGGEMENLSFAGDMAVSKIEDPAAKLKKQYMFGTLGDNYWLEGQFDRSISFNLSSNKSLERFELAEVSFDDYFYIIVNGVKVYQGPYGGNTLTAVTGTTLGAGATCSLSGSRWSCREVTGSVASEITMGSCPLNTEQDPAGPDKDGKTKCFAVQNSTYGNCIVENGGYICSDGCPPNTVQYQTGATTIGSGCGYRDLRTQFRFSPKIDLMPYLNTGPNVITTRTIVGGGGDMNFKIISEGCGAEKGYETENPPVPPTATPPALGYINQSYAEQP
ncbi:hypothetical protein LC612_23260 [Nostoc sp. CHAB 5834]|nr:hypothetical protein [Nostoc sp. CHAB 5834]